MTEGIIVALITGGMTLAGVLISTSNASKKSDQKIQTAMAVTDTKLDELTREVRMHNNFAEKIPVMAEQIKVINHRIGDLEQFHKPKD